MTDSKKLIEVFDKSGYKRSYIAKYVGLSLAGLMKKVNNESDFKALEIMKLCELLKISVPEKESVFFAVNVTKTDTNGRGEART